MQNTCSALTAVCQTRFMHNCLLRRHTRPALIVLAFVVLTAGAVAVAAPATQHGPSAARAIAPPRIGDSHIGADDAGDTLAVWTRGNSFEASVQPAGVSAWSPSQVLVKMNFPVGYWSLAVGRDGLAVLVWERRIGAISTIWARTARLPGTTWGPAVRVSGPAGVGVRAVVQAAVAPDGRAIAVWRERHGGSYVLLGAARAAGAAAWTAPSQSARQRLPGRLHSRAERRRRCRDGRLGVLRAQPHDASAQRQDHDVGHARPHVHDRALRSAQPSARSRSYAAEIRPRCVKACGKLPSASPLAPISSE